MKSFPRMASFPGSRLEAVAGMETREGLTGDHWVILTDNQPGQGMGPLESLP